MITDTTSTLYHTIVNFLCLIYLKYFILSCSLQVPVFGPIKPAMDSLFAFMNEHMPLTAVNAKETLRTEMMRCAIFFCDLFLIHFYLLNPCDRHFDYNTL